METQDLDSERVRKIRVPLYRHHEAGLDLQLKDMVLYLLNEDDFGISAADFDPSRHEHAIPKYEMARIYLLVCALTRDDLGFTADDRDDPVYQIYEKAWQRCKGLESEPELLDRLAEVAARAGFHAH